MLDEYFSYWLDIDGKDVINAAHMVNQDGTLEQVDINKNHAEFHVPEKYGTISIWSDMDSVLTKISAACPKTTLSVLEINETTKADCRHIYRDGQKILTRYSRIVEADNDYDEITVNAVITFFENKGLHGTANLIKTKFSSK